MSHGKDGSKICNNEIKKKNKKSNKYKPILQSENLVAKPTPTCQEFNLDPTSLKTPY